MAAMHNPTIQNLFWFRRDLRLIDNVALTNALKSGTTICCFIWDNTILDKLGKDNPRVIFIEKSLEQIKRQLNLLGSDLMILTGQSVAQITQLVKLYNIQNVFANEDYEPFAIARDENIKQELAQLNVNFHLFKDQVIFAKREILNQQNKPYIVYTPYKNAWLKNLTPKHYQSSETTKFFAKLASLRPQENYYQPSKNGFQSQMTIEAGENAAQDRLLEFKDKIDSYLTTRDYPDLNSTSFLGVDLRFGTISIRQLVQFTLACSSNGSETWLNELIWREFFSQILYNFPYVINSPFRPEYQTLQYINDLELFDKWCAGKTGYPIVDAGMRQLNQTGFMHNRVRMICASFLCKDLLIDWRWGEAYFAKKLLDYDLASNNGNWQWCSSTGCDAQPYFRIFNPYLQSSKFDSTGNYIRKYVPELANLDNKLIHNPPTDDLLNALDYPQPIVNHQEQTKLAKIMFANLKRIDQ